MKTIKGCAAVVIALTAARGTAAQVPAPLARHVETMFGYSAHGLERGVHRGLPSDRLTLVLSLDRPLRTAPGEHEWDAGVRDAQWVSLGGLHTRPAMIEQPGQWSGIQLTLRPLGIQALLGVPAADLPVASWDARDLLGREVDRVVDSPTVTHLRYRVVRS